MHPFCVCPDQFKNHGTAHPVRLKKSIVVIISIIICGATLTQRFHLPVRHVMDRLQNWE